VYLDAVRLYVREVVQVRMQVQVHEVVQVRMQVQVQVHDVVQVRMQVRMQVQMQVKKKGPSDLAQRTLQSQMQVEATPFFLFFLAFLFFFLYIP
jgi:thioredoxin-related protein